MSDFDVFNERRYLVAASSFDIGILNLKSPIAAAIWSFTFPGFGHFYTNNFVFGMALMIWEIAMNNLAKVNLCIYYSLQGNFEAAKESANLDWFVAYVLVYIFCFWDSYRRAVEINQQYLITFGSNKKIPVFTLSTSSISYLAKKNPWYSSLWGLVSPGLDHIYNGKLPTALFAIAWLGFINYKSHVLSALMYSCWGNFELAKKILDPQWFLFLPSIYGYVGYEGFAESNAINGTFKYEQTMFLRENFQDKDFVMPLK